MRPLRIAPAALALVALASLASCSRKNTAGLALSLALEQAYPGTQFDVAFRSNGTYHLVLTVDDSLTRAVSYSAREIRGRSLAHVVLEIYEYAAELDSITIMLVLEREDGFLSESYSANAETFAVRDLR